MIKEIMFIVVAMVCIFFIIKWKRNAKISKKIKLLLEKICHDYDLKLFEKQKDCDYLLVSETKKIKIVISDIPKNSSVTVNSRTTWCLRWGGKRVGRSYPNQRYMNELISFLKLPKEDDVLKLIIIFPTTEKIQKYLNESEIEVVKENELVYDYLIVRFNDLERLFKDIIDK